MSASARISTNLKLFIGSMMLWAVVLAGAARADTYVFDRDHTLVSFSWERTGLSRQQGRFTDVQGSVAFDPAKVEESTVDVTVRISSLQTGVDALDRQLRSRDFFDSGSFPVATFKSTQVRATAEKSGEVTGDLTIMGITKPVTLDVTWVSLGEHPHGSINAAYRGRTVAVFRATGSLKRSDWGLARVVPLVSDEIRLTIEAEMLKR